MSNVISIWLKSVDSDCSICAIASPQAAEGNYHGLKKFAVWALILLSLDTLKALCMQHKRSFFRSVKMLFLVKMVALHPIRSDTATYVFWVIPVLLYGLESLYLTRSDEKPLTLPSTVLWWNDHWYKRLLKTVKHTLIHNFVVKYIYIFIHHRDGSTVYITKT